MNTAAVLTSAGREPWLTVAPLTPSCKGEALSFLDERPFHTFGLSGLMLTNGVASPDLRGKFYVCRGRQGVLEGVALIGHANLFETRTGPALRAFARLTRQCADAAFLLGEEQEVSNFWAHYQEHGPADNVSHRELLLELRGVQSTDPAPGLRLATSVDLDTVVFAHAQIGLRERGVNPLDVDADGFRQRCARRIELCRTWVLKVGDKHIFKAEIVCSTPKVTYIESIAVHPEEQGKGHGLRCLSELARRLLNETDSICVLVQERNQRALDFYRKVGFTRVANYTSLFLDRRQVQ
jgi:ribosomal protein S18 acetylase RimI-like enzyme